MEIEGAPQKTLWDCIKGDMESFGLTCESSLDCDHW